MSPDLALSNLLHPPILFYFLGLLAALWRSDLDLPQPIPKALSLYLLLAIGFRGGLELAHGGGERGVLAVLAAAIALATLVPLAWHPLLVRLFGRDDGAAVAATYGSVSAVTFIAALSFLERLAIESSGALVAALALMESPAILVGVVLHRRGARAAGAPPLSWGGLLRDAFLNGSVFVLVGSLAIGAVTGERGRSALEPFVGDLFQGMLCLFLLDMGLVSGRRLPGLARLGVRPIAFALGAPPLQGAVGLAAAALLGLGPGDALLLCILAASASYIAVPAAMRVAVPEANPGLYVTMALALTFPLNLLIGLPAYLAVIQALWR